jgi:ankyrin repeat protein
MDLQDVTVSTYIQVFKRDADGKVMDRDEKKVAYNFMEGEETKIIEELLKKESYTLKKIKKGTTVIDGKSFYFMNYTAVKKPLIVDAVFYVFFTEDFNNRNSFYVFFISEAYIEGKYMADLGQIKPVIESFNTHTPGAFGKYTADDLLEAINLNDISRVKELLDKNVDINGKSRNDWTALMVAAAKGNTEMVQLLLKNGANVNVRNKTGQTPIIFAAHWGHIDIVKLLIDSGVDVNAQMDDGWTALIDAVNMDRLEVTKLLIEGGANVNMKSSEGWTALLAATLKNHVEIVKLLINRGADLNAKDVNNRSALRIAKSKGHTEITELLSNGGTKQ